MCPHYSALEVDSSEPEPDDDELDRRRFGALVNLAKSRNFFVLARGNGEFDLSPRRGVIEFGGSFAGCRAYLCKKETDAHGVAARKFNKAYGLCKARSLRIVEAPPGSSQFEISALPEHGGLLFTGNITGCIRFLMGQPVRQAEGY